MKNIIKLTAIIVLLTSLTIMAQNQAPVVTNVTFSERTDSSFIVDVYYDVNDADGNTMTVTILVSNDSGQTWGLSANNITGDVGAGVTSGTGKHIIWDFGTEHPNYFSDQIQIKIIADDGVNGSGTPCPGTPTVTYAGKTYNTVQIGNQCWLKENLDVRTMVIFNSSSDNQTNNGIIEKYCYNNDPNNCSTYGGLYQWSESMKYASIEKAQGICPAGWHIPTKTEYEALANEVGVRLSTDTFSGSNALKAVGQGTGGGTGSNISGFSALLSGNSDTIGGFGYLNVSTYFWSSTEIINNGWGLYLTDDNDYIYFGSTNGNYGFSIRCLKD